MTRNVAFATCSKRPELTDDDQLAVKVLARRGIRATPALWDSTAVDWRLFDAVVIRSTWDYCQRYESYLSWIDLLENLGVPLWNPIDVIRWNSEKTYLCDLARHDVPMAPMVIVGRGTTPSLAGIVQEQGWAKAVVKPTVGAAACDSWLTDPKIALHEQSAFDGLLLKSDVIVQEFLPQVTEVGEWSLVVFNKEYSHAVLKRPRRGDYRVQGRYGGTTMVEQPPRTFIDQAMNIVELIEGPLLYARVDAVDVDGWLMLMEIELIEPMLFFSHDLRSQGRFADSLMALMR